jgi:hypothetical protein
MFLNLQFMNAQGGVNGDSPTDASRYDWDEMVRALVTAEIETSYQKNPDQEEQFGGSPVRDHYFAHIHPDLMYMIEKTDGFVPWWEYPEKLRPIPLRELGAIGNCRLYRIDYKFALVTASAFGNTIYEIPITTTLDDFSSGMVLRCTER